MRAGDEAGRTETTQQIRAYYFSAPEQEEAIKKKGINSHRYLFKTHDAKPQWAIEHEKEEKELGVEGLAPIHAFILPPQFIGKDIGKRIFSELKKRYGVCVKSFVFQIDQAVYLRGDADKNAMDRAIHPKNLIEVLAVSSCALENANDESLFKWLIKALVLTEPITEWQEIAAAKLKFQ